MLDPYYIINLKQESGSKASQYGASLKAPDKLGVYKFMVEYNRYGYTLLDEMAEVTVM